MPNRVLRAGCVVTRGARPVVEVLERRALLAAATVNFSDVRQTVDGFGASSAWSWSAFPSPAIDQLFSPTTGAGLSLLRSHIYPHGWSSENANMQQMASYPVRVWSSPWSPPREWKTNNDNNHGGYLDPAHYQDYATQLATYCLDMKAQGVDLYAISLQNEPDENVSYESCLWTEDQFAAFLPYVGQTFASRGVTTKIMLSERTGWNFDTVNSILANPSLSQYLDILAAHNYDRTYSPYRTIYGSLNKPFWETEVYLGGSGSEITDALTLADDIHDAFQFGNVSAYHYWWLSASGYGGLMGSNYTPSKRLWAMGQYSRFVRPGWVMVGETDDGSLSITTFKDPASGKFALVVANTNTSTGVPLTFTLANGSASYVTPYITSGTAGDDLKAYGTITLTGGTTFSATIAANSVVTYYGTLSGVATLQAPTSLKVAPQYQNSKTQLALSWTDNSSSETAYTVERSPDGTNSWTTLTSTLAADSTTYVSTSLTENTRYFYRVKATSGASSSAYSLIVAGATTLASPSSVTLTSATNGYKLTWTRNSAVNTAVTVDRSPDGITWSSIATLGSATLIYTDSNIPGYTSSKSYFYRVRNTAGSVISPYAANNTALPTPTGFASSNVTATTATFSWTNAATSASGASIERTNSGSGGWSTVSPSYLTPGTPANVWTNTGLAENTTYQFRLRVSAQADFVWSSYTSAISVTTPVAAPDDLVATSVNSTTAQLAWSDNSAIETAYSVERSPNGTTWTVLSSNVAAGSTTYTDTAAPTGTVYYRVKAVSNATSSAYAKTQLLSAAPAITVAASPVTTTTTGLTVSSLSGFGTAPLNYLWSLDGTPPASVSFSSNGTTSALNTAATFSLSGSYSLRVTITDANGYTTTATAPLTVSQTLSSITLTANGSAITRSTWQQVTAKGYDQFAQVMSVQPTFTWTVVSGGGSISTSGLYSAPASAASPVVRASSGSISGQTTLSVISTPTPTAVYAFNEGSGSAALDYLGAGITGSLSGSISYVTGRRGTALQFDGTSASVWLGNSSPLKIAGQITLAAWVKPASLSGTQIIIGQGYGSWPNQLGTYLRINSGKYEAGIYNGGYYSASYTIPAGDLNTWVHLVGTYDGQTWRLYRNGTQVATYANATGATVAPKSWRIGASDIPNQYFAGTLDSVRIYAQAISASDVSALYSQSIAITTPIAATPSPVTGTSTSLSIRAADPDTNSDSLLTYTWSTTGSPSAPVSFTPNSSLAARNSVATFSRAGSYGLLVTITDPSGSTLTSPLNVTVVQTPSAIAVSPATATIPINSTQSYSATVTDQFNSNIASPSITWSATGGTINSSGLYTAGATAGSGFSATATLGSLSVSSAITLYGPTTYSSLTINDGSAQRSRVTSLALRFSSPVTLGPDALSLTRRSGAFTGSLIISPASGSSAVFTLIFTGASIVAASLPDGIYDLALNPTAIIDAYSRPLSGSPAPLTFFRLFGDSNGDASVNSTDLTAITAAYAFNSSSPNYRSYFDYDANLVINNTDLLQFRRRLNTSLQIPPQSLSLRTAPGITRSIAPSLFSAAPILLPPSILRRQTDLFA
jgi:O-glycosyl hydrolase